MDLGSSKVWHSQIVIYPNPSDDWSTTSPLGVALGTKTCFFLADIPAVDGSTRKAVTNRLVNISDFDKNINLFSERGSLKDSIKGVGGLASSPELSFTLSSDLTNPVGLIGRKVEYLIVGGSDPNVLTDSSVQYTGVIYSCDPGKLEIVFTVRGMVASKDRALGDPAESLDTSEADSIKPLVYGNSVSKLVKDGQGGFIAPPGTITRVFAYDKQANREMPVIGNFSSVGGKLNISSTEDPEVTLRSLLTTFEYLIDVEDSPRLFLKFLDSVGSLTVGDVYWWGDNSGDYHFIKYVGIFEGYYEFMSDYPMDIPPLGTPYIYAAYAVGPSELRVDVADSDLELQPSRIVFETGENDDMPLVAMNNYPDRDFNVSEAIPKPLILTIGDEKMQVMGTQVKSTVLPPGGLPAGSPPWPETVNYTPYTRMSVARGYQTPVTGHPAGAPVYTGELTRRVRISTTLVPKSVSNFQLREMNLPDDFPPYIPVTLPGFFSTADISTGYLICNVIPDENPGIFEIDLTWDSPPSKGKVVACYLQGDYWKSDSGYFRISTSLLTGAANKPALIGLTGNVMSSRDLSRDKPDYLSQILAGAFGTDSGVNTYSGKEIDLLYQYNGDSPPDDKRWSRLITSPDANFLTGRFVLSAINYNPGGTPEPQIISVKPRLYVEMYVDPDDYEFYAESTVTDSEPKAVVKDLIESVGLSLSSFGPESAESLALSIGITQSGKMLTNLLDEIAKEAGLIISEDGDGNVVVTNLDFPDYGLVTFDDTSLVVGSDNNAQWSQSYTELSNLVTGITCGYAFKGTIGKVTETLQASEVPGVQDYFDTAEGFLPDGRPVTMDYQYVADRATLEKILLRMMPFRSTPLRVITRTETMKNHVSYVGQWVTMDSSVIPSVFGNTYLIVGKRVSQKNGTIDFTLVELGSQPDTSVVESYSGEEWQETYNSGEEINECT